MRGMRLVGCVYLWIVSLCMSIYVRVRNDLKKAREKGKKMA